MSLAFYDEEQDLAINPLRNVINGHTGGFADNIFYIRNDDVSKWYTNISISIVTDVYDALGELGSTGISVKFIYGERRPTEAEWDVAIAGAAISLPDIGTTDLADTFTYHPVWCRIYIPGGSPADIIDSNHIRLTYLPRTVGA